MYVKKIISFLKKQIPFTFYLRPYIFPKFVCIVYSNFFIKKKRKSWVIWLVKALMLHKPSSSSREASLDT